MQKKLFDKARNKYFKTDENENCAAENSCLTGELCSGFLSYDYTYKADEEGYKADYEAG